MRLACTTMEVLRTRTDLKYSMFELRCTATWTEKTRTRGNSTVQHSGVVGSVRVVVGSKSSTVLVEFDRHNPLGSDAAEEAGDCRHDQHGQVSAGTTVEGGGGAVDDGGGMCHDGNACASRPQHLWPSASVVRALWNPRDADMHQFNRSNTKGPQAKYLRQIKCADMYVLPRHNAS